MTTSIKSSPCEMEGWGRDDVSSLGTGSKETYAMMDKCADAKRLQREKLRRRENGWTSLHATDRMLTYDAILDPHCLYTKTARFRRRIVRVLKEQFEDRYKHQLAMLARRRALQRLPTRLNQEEHVRLMNAPASAPPLSRLTPDAFRVRSPMVQQPLQIRVRGRRRSSAMRADALRTIKHQFNRASGVVMHRSEHVEEEDTGATARYYTLISPYLTPNGPFCAPLVATPIAHDVPPGTLLLMLPGLDEPLATIIHRPADTLWQLRQAIEQSLDHVFPTNFTFLEHDTTHAIPFSDEPYITLTACGGCVYVRPQIKQKVILPVFTELEVTSGRAGGRSAPCQMVTGRMSLSRGSVRSSFRGTIDGSKSKRVKRMTEEQKVEALKEAVQGLALKYMNEAAVKMQKVVRGKWGREKARARRDVVNRDKSLAKSATKIQAAFRRWQAVRDYVSMKAQAMNSKAFFETMDFGMLSTFKLPVLLYATTQGQQISGQSDAPDGLQGDAENDAEQQKGSFFAPMNAIIKMQSMFRRRLAAKVALRRRREREKDLALDAALKGRKDVVVGDAQAQATATLNAELQSSMQISSARGSARGERTSQSLLRDRRKEVQQAMVTAERVYQARQRRHGAGAAQKKVMKPAELAKMIQEHTGQGMGDGGMIDGNGHALLTDEEAVVACEPIYSTDVPLKEGVMTMRVFHTGDEIIFQAYLPTQSATYHLKFDSESADPQVADYINAPDRPDSPKLMQVLCQSVKLTSQHAAPVMDLEAFGGKSYVFDLALTNPLDAAPSLTPRNNRLLIEDMDDDVVARRYLPMSCAAVECDDCKWRVRVDAADCLSGEDISLTVGPEQWEAKLGMGDWRKLCSLQKLYVLRTVCQSMHVVRRHETSCAQLECRLVTGFEERPEDTYALVVSEGERAPVKNADKPLHLRPLSVDFCLTSLPRRRLLCRLHATISGEQSPVFFYLKPTSVEVRAHRKRMDGTVYVCKTEIPAEDPVYLLAARVEELVEFCRSVSQKLAWIKDREGQLHVPVTSFGPFLHFNFNTWDGESRSFGIRVYKVANDLFVLAHERERSQAFFALLSRDQYKYWDIPNVGRVHTDETAQEHLMSVLKARMTLPHPRDSSKGEYVLIHSGGFGERAEQAGKDVGKALKDVPGLRHREMVPINSRNRQRRRSSVGHVESLFIQEMTEAADESEFRTSSKTDDNLSYRYVGMLVDKGA